MGSFNLWLVLGGYYPISVAGVLALAQIKTAPVGAVFIEEKRFLVELFFFGRTGQRLHARRATLDDGGDFVEVTGADFLLV
jgi:hypothetical protein